MADETTVAAAAAVTSAYEAAAAKREVPVLPFVRDQLINAKTAFLSGRGAEAPLELDIRGNQAGIRVIGRPFGPADLEAISEALAALDLPIVALHAGFNELGDSGAALVAGMLQTHPVQVLDLTANSISGVGVSALTSALPKCPSFHSLVLDLNPIGDVGGAAIASLVGAHPNLQHLSLARCELGIDSIIRISGALETTATLAHLDLSEPRLSSRNSEATQHLARALRGNRSLRSLALRKFPHLTDTSLEALVDGMLDSGGGLTDLDLGANSLAGPGGVLLAKALETGGLGLRRLLLAHCRIGDEGATALATVLGRGGVTLDLLDVRSNSIGDRGLAALAEAICIIPGPGAGAGGRGAAAAGPAATGASESPLRALRIAGNTMPAGSVAAAAVGRVLLARATTTVVDVRAFEVDGALQLAVE